MPDPTPAPVSAPAPVEAAAGASKPEVAATPPKTEARKLKIPIPDVGEVDLDETEAIALLSQFGKARHDDFKGKKEAEEYKAKLSDKAKLKLLLKELGHDPAKLGEEWLKEIVDAEVEKSTLTPEQRELKELKEWKAKKAADEAAAEAAAKKKADDEKFEAEATAEFESLKATALEVLKATNLPEEMHSHPDVLARLGQLMQRAHQKQWKIPAAILAKQLEATIQKEHDYVFSQFKPETLLAKLGRKNVEAIIRAYAKSLEPKAEETPALPTAAARKPVQRDELSVNEMRRKLREEQYTRAKEEAALVRGASRTTARYYGNKG